VIRFTETGGVWSARAAVAVGIDRLDLAVDLGPLPEAPDPGGLLATPVVTVGSGSCALASAGARRAGKVPTTVTMPADAPWLPGQLLVAVRGGAEVLIVEDGGTEALVAARVLGGRPLPVLPLDDPVALAGLLNRLPVDVHLAVPAAGEDDRAASMALLRPRAPERRHHLVDVDPRPAFDELGWDLEKASLGDRAAAAAGVLAGRMAAGNRRWRS
jgi:hypothetical protein